MCVNSLEKFQHIFAKKFLINAMINVISKSGNLAPYLKATTQVVASGLKPAAAAVTLPKESVVAHPGTPTSSHSLGKVLPRGPISVVSGPAGTAPPTPEQCLSRPSTGMRRCLGEKFTCYISVEVMCLCCIPQEYLLQCVDIYIY